MGSMSVVTIYLRIYASCLKRAQQGILKSPWTLLLPIGFFAVSILASSLLGHLGFLGGMLTALAMDAIFASYLYVVSETVDNSKVRIEELSRSIGPFFWAVLNLMFVLWIGRMILGFALANNPHSGVIYAIAQFAAFVLMNATPEVIYQRHTHGGLQTIQRTIQFVHESWIEWFIPNLLFGAAFYYGTDFLLNTGVPWFAVAIVGGALLHVVMVFRGHLFRELDGSSHRQRMFKHRSV